MADNTDGDERIPRPRAAVGGRGKPRMSPNSVPVILKQRSSGEPALWESGRPQQAEPERGEGSGGRIDESEHGEGGSDGENHPKPALSVPASAAQQTRSSACKHWVQGRCRWGATCRYSHNAPGAMDTSGRGDACDRDKKWCNKVWTACCPFVQGSICGYWHVDQWLELTDSAREQTNMPSLLRKDSANLLKALLEGAGRLASERPDVWGKFLAILQQANAVDKGAGTYDPVGACWKGAEQLRERLLAAGNDKHGKMTPPMQAIAELAKLVEGKLEPLMPFQRGRKLGTPKRALDVRKELDAQAQFAIRPGSAEELYEALVGFAAFSMQD